jgi:preprotein translocase subunit YajC
MKNIWILALADDEGQVISSVSTEGQNEEIISVDNSEGQAPQVTSRRESSPLVQFLPLVLIFVIMYLLLFRGPRKKQQKHKQMVQSLHKNDRVRTIGGIFGTVIDVRDDVITLKVDESNNTKIKVTSGAISSVLLDDQN